eukprot:SAG25_NODE_10141_length_344_cov_1.681633_1_plen_29_part_01
MHARRAAVAGGRAGRLRERGPRRIVICAT